MLHLPFLIQSRCNVVCSIVVKTFLNFSIKMFYVFIRQFKKLNKTRLCLLFFNVFFISFSENL